MDLSLRNLTGAEERQYLKELFKDGCLTKELYDQLFAKPHLHTYSALRRASIAGPAALDYEKYQAKNAYKKQDGTDNDEYGVTMVSGMPLSIEVIKTMDIVKQALLETGILPENSLSFYYQNHTHATISSMIRGTHDRILNLIYNKVKDKGTPEETKVSTIINTDKILDVTRSALPFTLVFNSLTINGKGEILLLGNTTKETKENLLNFRKQLITEANFDGRPEDQKDAVHTMVGYIKDFDSLTRNQKQAIAQHLENAIINLPNLGTFEVNKVYLIYYLHRSMRKVINLIPLEFGKDYPALRGKVEKLLLKEVSLTTTAQTKFLLVP